MSIEREKNEEGIIVYWSWSWTRRTKTTGISSFLGCTNFETQIHTPGGACTQGWAHVSSGPGQVQAMAVYRRLILVVVFLNSMNIRSSRLQLCSAHIVWTHLVVSIKASCSLMQPHVLQLNLLDY